MCPSWSDRAFVFSSQLWQTEMAVSFNVGWIGLRYTSWLKEIFVKAEKLIEEFVSEQGWSDSSVVNLLCEFIDYQKSHEALKDFLDVVVETLNEIEGA